MLSINYTLHLKFPLLLSELPLLDRRMKSWETSKTKSFIFRLTAFMPLSSLKTPLLVPLLLAGSANTTKNVPFAPWPYSPLSCSAHNSSTPVVWDNFSGFPSGSTGKEFACQWRRYKRCGFCSWVSEIPWKRKWLPTPVFFPGKFHGQRSLVGYSPWGHKESDITECTHKHTQGHFKGNIGRKRLSWVLGWTSFMVQRQQEPKMLTVTGFCLGSDPIWSHLESNALISKHLPWRDSCL